MIWVGIVAVFILLIIIGVVSARGSSSNLNANANEPDVFASVMRTSIQKATPGSRRVGTKQLIFPFVLVTAL
jgi:hypothetical protein